MAYSLADVNYRVLHEPEGLVEECNERYEQNIRRAANRIAGNLEKSRIVLLSGPSGSGKTTTAQNIERRLRSMDLETHTISMDDYYLDVSERTPRNEKGEYDFESPECLDLDLLRRHFEQLDRGEEVIVPHFDFRAQKRDPSRGRPLRLAANELAIFEGIHALNGAICGEGQSANAFKVYISARSNFELDGAVVFKGTWIRILRRVVRDEQFRGTSPAVTFAMWENLRRGEKQYISPYKNTAGVMFDSSFAYEVSAMRALSEHVFDGVTPDFDRYREILHLRDALDLFEPLDARYIPENAMIREFIGSLGL